jgi:uncharacterized membrane protein
MESRAKVLGHPLHQMLIVFPLGLLATSNVFDAIAAATDNPEWSETGHHMMAAGIIGGLSAAVPGLIDFLAIPGDTRAKRIGLIHGVGNVAVTGLYAASWLLRREDPGAPSRSAIGLAAAGAMLALVTGWLGGELVDRLGVGVSDNAHLDAPSSLTRNLPIIA